MNAIKKIMACSKCEHENDMGLTRTFVRELGVWLCEECKKDIVVCKREYIVRHEICAETDCSHLYPHLKNEKCNCECEANGNCVPFFNFEGLVSYTK